MNRYIHFRASPAHEAKLQSMAEALGTNPSAVLRELVENAELRPVRFSPVAVLPTKNHIDNQLSTAGINVVAA